jgi:NAD(P)-dependent dehydrogenase (short-subunit alcohol dehydrogenase family)
VRCCGTRRGEPCPSLAATSPRSLESAGIKVNAASPGFTKTNLNNYAGTETVEQGAREAVHLALLGPGGPTGTFSLARDARTVM